LGLHNEDFELTTVDGKRTYDLLLDFLDPKLITFQFQISTISRGYDAAEYFTKYPGRFVSMHAQDWSAALQKTVALGEGDLDWSKIFNAARVGGIRNYFVELNLDAMRASVSYLRGLKV
jgi:sugar phosphate isomerase/epimerase